jgi:CRP/FNR family transcriptional regulator
MPLDRIAPSDLAGFLREVPYFASLEPAALARLADQIRILRVPAHILVVAEGDPAANLYFVVEGCLKAYRTSVDGREQVLAIINAPETFNDVPVFDDGDTPVSVSALSDSVIGLVPKATIRSLMAETPSLGNAAVGVLAGRLRETTGAVADLAFGNVSVRVAKTLLGFECRVRRRLLAGHCSGDIVPMTQEEVAARVGSVREVVQRELKKLEQKGLIRMERSRVVIVDRRGLEELCP